MGSNSERHTAPIDRISNLPDNLITHILSFLSTEDAVRISTLSTHWNKKWALKTNLDFDDGMLIKENSTLEWNPTPRSMLSFINFVYRVLLYKVTRLDSFRITGAHRGYDASNVSQWLSIALSRDVSKIGVQVPLVIGHCLQTDQLFSSKSLVVLILGFGFLLKVPEIISLESLEVLHLNYVQFEDGESLTRLVSGCPVLRELKIEGELCKTVNVLYVSSPVLKSLILSKLYTLRILKIDGAHSFKVVLNTPSLQFLELNDDGVPDGYHIESTLNCLDEAKLSLSLSSYQFDELILARSMQDLAVAISNVQFLDLSQEAYEAFCGPDCILPDFQLPAFPRLINLVIGTIEGQFGLLRSFLQSSPQLESLYFALVDEFVSWDQPTKVPSCMLYNLRYIEIYYLESYDRDPKGKLGLSVVKYFLEKTNCLEELIISFREEKNEEFIKEVSLLPRASKSCKIVYS